MRHSTLLIAVFLLTAACSAPKITDDLTVIPPGKVSSKINLDIRCSIKNNGKLPVCAELRLYAGDSLLNKQNIIVRKGSYHVERLDIPASKLIGKGEIRLETSCCGQKNARVEPVQVVESDIRSTRGIDGAYLGITHWSDLEGKNWNPAQRLMTDGQWKEMICSMHKIGMDIITIQELFHCDNKASKGHDATVETYPGQAYYPSELYSARMEMTAKDPVEVIFAVADSLGMKVLPGIGNFARFDFSQQSLQWHKNIAKEVWDKYGHHPSFYGFYVSEESGGSLDLWKSDPELAAFYQQEIVDFFREFRAYCNDLAPAKPTMFSTNSFGVKKALEVYPELMKSLDILCPFGFARMPKNDYTGYEVANILQKICDEQGAHLWFDLEAFLFNPDSSLYPRDIEGIIGDLTLLDNFEKVICYQYPGVFSDPASEFLVGEPKTLDLFRNYQQYYLSLQKY